MRQPLGISASFTTEFLKSETTYRLVRVHSNGTSVDERLRVSMPRVMDEQCRVIELGRRLLYPTVAIQTNL